MYLKKINDNSSIKKSRKEVDDGSDRKWSGIWNSDGIPGEFCVYCDMCACHLRSTMDSRKTERGSVYGTVSYRKRNVLHSCGILFQKASDSSIVDSKDFD